MTDFTQKIVMYATQSCPYCIRAKQLLDFKSVDYEVIDVGVNPTLQDQMMQHSGGAHTVPQIFIYGEHIGGCDELYELERLGQLDNKLNP